MKGALRGKQVGLGCVSGIIRVAHGAVVKARGILYAVL